MIILPAIDLKDGKCVRLYQGKFSSSKVVAEDPIDTALKFKEKGGEYLHIVDLDGALNGKPKNLNIISEIIKKVKIPIEVGGGIRDIKTIDILINKGVSRIILGTIALKDPSIVLDAVKKYGDKIAVGIDAKDKLVAVNGWTNVSKINYIEFAKKIESIGVKNIIFTDISKDGTLEGPNFLQTFELQKEVSCNIIASGGIKNIEDLKILNDKGIYGAIIGKSIYSGNISLEEAINKLK